MPSKFLLLNHPIRTLILSFLAWKTLLLVIAAASPGPGYDTSASLLSGSSDNPAGELPAALHYLVGKLTKWDAIYFVKSANRGYLFEQEWAFGWGFSRVIALCTSSKDFQQTHSTHFCSTLL
jgi:phosphatidylinositol glycan class V